MCMDVIERPTSPTVVTTHGNRRHTSSEVHSDTNFTLLRFSFEDKPITSLEFWK
jgi:hypothetical protein